MINKISRSIFYLIIILGMTACNSVTSQSKADNITNIVTTIPDQHKATTSSTEEDAILLCNKLNAVKLIPYSPKEVADDPIYNGLYEKGVEAIPCLIDKITDTNLMEDPRTAPHINDFRVGDAAVFILLMITEEKWQPETMLSPEYAKLWKTEGVYAYFDYVENPANRKKLQLWWKNWMKENLNKKIKIDRK